VGPETTLPAGTILGGRYRLIRLVGHGGMGSVYEAQQMDLGRRVAVKILDARLTFEAQHIERFRREAHAAAMLGHPNIVQVTDFQSNPNEPPFLVMDFLEGQSLAQRLERQGRIDARQAALIGIQVLDALGAAHRAGIVHRDIKPDNLFLVQVPAVGEIVKVLDFGVAKLSDAPPSSAPLTATGAMLGTPAYMAPEQARGNAVDLRADLYAVGASLYHALTGMLPFNANSAPALLFAIVEQQPAPLSQSRPDIPRELVAIIERAMQKDPARRFQSADEMRAALATLAQVSPASMVVITPGVAIAPASAYAATIGSTPAPMTPGPTPQPFSQQPFTPQPISQPLAPGVAVPSGVPLVMGQPPTFGGVAQPTPFPPPVAQKPSNAAAVVRNVFLGIIGILIVIGGVALLVIYVMKRDTPVAGAPSASASQILPAAISSSSGAAGASSASTTTTSTSTGTSTTTGSATTSTPPVAVNTKPAVAFTTTATQGAAPARFGNYLNGAEIDLNPVLPPAPTSALHPFSGKRINGGGSNGVDFGPDKPCSICDNSAFRHAVPDAVINSCYAGSQFEGPIVHEDRGYFYSFDSTGQVTHVWRMSSYPSVPRLDACLARALLGTKMVFSKPPPSGGFGQISYMAECDIGWHDHCQAISGGGGAAPTKQ
jgi:serine/threonine-protein kinase